jgi:hypothetical protein
MRSVESPSREYDRTYFVAGPLSHKDSPLFSHKYLRAAFLSRPPCAKNTNTHEKETEEEPLPLTYPPETSRIRILDRDGGS